MGAADPSPVDWGGEEGRRPRASACIPSVWRSPCLHCGAGGALAPLGSGWASGNTCVHRCPLPAPQRSQIKLKGLREARPRSPRGFCFCPSGFTCAPAWNSSWGVWGCFVLVTIATGPGLGSPVQEGGLGPAAAGEPPPPQSPRMWVQPLRPLPGAFLSLLRGPAHKTFVSSPQGPCGGQGPCFAREETEAQGRMGAYKLGP